MQHYNVQLMVLEVFLYQHVIYNYSLFDTRMRICCVLYVQYMQYVPVVERA